MVRHADRSDADDRQVNPTSDITESESNLASDITRFKNEVVVQGTAALVVLASVGYSYLVLEYRGGN
jgi:hypothetical protein